MLFTSNIWYSNTKSFRNKSTKQVKKNTLLEGLFLRAGVLDSVRPLSLQLFTCSINNNNNSNNNTSTNNKLFCSE